MTENYNNECKILPLSDCLEYITRGIAPKYVPISSICALNQKAIRWGYIETNYLKYHDPNKKVREDVYIQKGDIVINSTGDITIGRAYYFKRDWPNLFADSHVTIIRLNRDILLPEFCIYLFPTQEYQTKIYGLVTGTTGQLELSKNNLRKLKVLVPPLPIQRKIAAILSAYDDLIENNTRRIRILEEMAQTIYQEWFVKFHFPGHEGVKMVDSPLGLIPEGWEVLSVEQAFNTLGGSTPSTKVPEYWDNGDIIWFSPSDLTAAKSMFISDSEKKINKFGLKNSSAKIFPAYCVMMTSRATIGVVAINTRPACTNQGFITCIPNERLSMYQIYFWILINKEKIDNVASGSTYKEINRTEFREFLITIPDIRVTNHFTQIITPIGKEIEILIEKNQNLRRTRDLLLPKLISGEVDVETLAIETPVNKS